MTGVFTLSLDCEGLWGMADQPNVLQSRQINKTSLTRAYDFILEVLGRNNIIATAAFVSAFCCDRELLRTLLPEFEALDSSRPGWLTHVLPRLRIGTDHSMDGLEGEGQWRRMAAEGHEIGWHGATHIPLGPDTPAAAVDQEIRIAQTIFNALGLHPRSVVFPRNQVGHLTRIRPLGLTNYRTSRPADTLTRLTAIAEEVCFWGAADLEQPRFQEGWCELPPGRFLNWPSGPRALVPTAVTVGRWKSMLRGAVRTGGLVHMWFHPHNLITAPRMRESFSRVLHEVGDLVRRGDLVNLTMAGAEAHFDRSLSR